MFFQFISVSCYPPSDTAGTNTRTHNSRCTSALFTSQKIQSLYTNKHMSLTATYSHSTLQQPHARNFFFFLRRYNFREVLAFSTSFFHFVRFLTQSFQFVIFILVILHFTSSSHLFLSFPNDLVSAGDHSYTHILAFSMLFKNTFMHFSPVCENGSKHLAVVLSF